ncbi:MAG: serine/threonine-protein kinase [Deltaproteobacteria bacterium]
MADLPRVFGRYMLLKSLGSGGTGDVHLARPLDRDAKAPSPVVIKRLHAQLAQQENFVRRFAHEADIAVAVNTPHVAKAFDVGRVGETFYIAMEYIAGWTVSRIASDLEKSGRRPTLPAIADIVCGGLAGLAALHDAVHPETGQVLHIVHRDIAPKNLMLGEDGVTRLIDLGLGKSTVQDWKTGTGVVMGSPGYMSPEQVIAGDVDRRADLYAMGIVLWELLTQQFYIKRAALPLMLRAQTRPNQVPPSKLRDDVSPELDAVVMRALHPDPAQRFEDADEFCAALRGAIPEDKSQGAAATIVSDLLWGELGESKTEVTQLLSRVTSSPNLEATEGVEVFALREGVDLGRVVPQIEVGPARTPDVHAEAAMGPDVSTPTPYASYSGLSAVTPPSKGVPMQMVVALMVLMLLAGAAGALVLTRAPAQPAEVVTAAPMTPPKITVIATPEARPEPEPVEAAEEQAPVTKTRRRRARPAPPPAAEAPPPAEAPAPTMKSLVQRALALQNRRPGDREVSKLVTQLMMESQRSQITDDELRALAKKIRAAEKQGQ